jgi:hypothetical protein
MADVLRALKDKVGKLHATFEYPDEETSGADINRLEESGAEGVSYWRYCTQDRSRWYITVLGEREDLFDRAVSFLTGKELELPPDPLMLNALRNRRYQLVLTSMARGEKELRQERRHFGEKGASLYRSGRMEPNE